jgi:hypothetical protein
LGGAAIAVTVYDERRTLDVDAVVSDRTVLDEARLLAESEGIPQTWLTENARPSASSSSSWACPDVGWFAPIWGVTVSRRPAGNCPILP